MKRIILILFAVLCCTFHINAQERRPIDNKHPLWLVHIDVWNNADPQKIIDLIPNDIKPYVCMNLSMSCSYDTDLKIYKKPQDAIQTYRSWASVCCRNNMWFTCQPASGGHTHIKDTDLDTFESFFIDYKNFLGWNYAEQFWGFDEPNDASSSTQTARITLFSKLVPMHHKYGGFLTISFCGNIWSHPLNPIGMMKRNSNLLKACKEYPEAILWLYKYTTSSCWHNNESACIGPFISGLAKNYGVRYDNCGYNGAVDDALGSNHGKKYPAAVGIAAVLEQMTLNGACVWDGPELIWTEDFKATNTTTVSNHTRRNWATYPTFDKIWVDMWRKVIDGTIYIPTREEVVQRTKVALIANNTSGNDQDKYATPNGLYDGLYLQDKDPLNAGSSFSHSKGNYMSNRLFLKKTGRYQTIPLIMSATYQDSLCKTITKKVTATNYSSTWSTKTKKVSDFNKYYPEVSKGDAFVARHHNELTCYYPYSYFNSLRSASAEIPLLYNSCDTLHLGLGKFSTILAHEYADHMTFYLNNYRTDTTTSVKDTILIKGCSEKPTYSIKKRAQATSSVAASWNEEAKTYRLVVNHLGPLDITLNCVGSSEKELLTDIIEVTPLDPEDIKQPEDYYGDLIIEAEDMDYQGINACVTDQYGWAEYRSVRGHSAMGFARMGTNKTGSLRNPTKINFSGKYLIKIKYHATAASNITVSFNTTDKKTLALEACATNEWKYATFESEAKEGSNVFMLLNSGGKDCYIDNVTFSPIELDIFTGIEDVVMDNNQWNDEGEKTGVAIRQYFSTSGARLAKPQRGLNIIRMPNNTYRKVMVK